LFPVILCPYSLLVKSRRVSDPVGELGDDWWRC
jgi:hypothetical protein